jgi:hypothetical protein
MKDIYRDTPKPDTVIPYAGYELSDLEPQPKLDNPSKTLVIRGLGSARRLRRGLVPRPPEPLFVPLEWTNQDSGNNK